MSKLPVVVACLFLLLGVAAGGAGTYWLIGSGRLPVAGAAEVGRKHDEEHEHAGADKHGHGGDEHDPHEEGVVKLSPAVIKEMGIETTPASGGVLERTLTLPAEIALNADKVAHIVPRVTGTVHAVFKSVGDTVQPGDVMAVIESRELAEAKAGVLAADARLQLADAQHQRTENLVKQQLASERVLGEVRQRLEEARIEHRTMEAKLHALGLTEEQVVGIAKEKQSEYARFELKAPFAGQIVDKHITLGEQVGTDRDVFVVADLSTVWGDITVYPQFADQTRTGQRVRLMRSDAEEKPAEATIAYVSPIIREGTRAGLARAVLANDKGRWRPGEFVRSEVVLGEDHVPVMVPQQTIQTIENAPVLFVEHEGWFEKRTITLGKTNVLHAEVTQGLKAGERYVTRGAFVLKAELNKGSGEHEH